MAQESIENIVAVSEPVEWTPELIAFTAFMGVGTGSLIFVFGTIIASIFRRKN